MKLVLPDTYFEMLIRGQNGNGAVLVFTDQCTLGGTGP